jgi:hypothetical protein
VSSKRRSGRRRTDQIDGVVLFVPSSAIVTVASGRGEFLRRYEL